MTSLNLERNGIGAPDGWIVELSELGTFKRFKHEDGRTQTDHPGGVCSGVVALAEALVNTPLTKLDIRQNELDEAAKALIRDAAKKKGMSLEL